MIDSGDILELELECTTMCNARCPLCYRNYKTFEGSKYSEPFIRNFQDVVSQLDTFQNLKFVMLVGSMSEPTLYPDFLELVSYLKGRGIKIEICTNGDTQNESFWRNLGDKLDDQDIVYFTICGCTQEIHQRYRIGTSLQNIVMNAGFLREQRRIDCAQCIRFKYNSSHLDSIEFKRFVKQFSKVYMTETFFPKEIGCYKDVFDIQDFMPCDEKLEEYIKLKRFAEKRYELNAGNRSDCMSRRTGRFQMDVFGNIFPCYLFLESSNGVPWSQNIDDTFHVNEKCCIFCDEMVQKYAKRHRLEYII